MTFIQIKLPIRMILYSNFSWMYFVSNWRHSLDILSVGLVDIYPYVLTWDDSLFMLMKIAQIKNWKVEL